MHKSVVAACLQGVKNITLLSGYERRTLSGNFFFLSKTRISEFPSLNFDLIIFSAVQNIPFQNRLSAWSAVLPRNLKIQSVSHSTVTA